MNLFSNAGSDKDDRSEKYEEFEVFSHLFQGVSLAVTRIDLKNIRSSKYFLFWETFQVASH